MNSASARLFLPERRELTFIPNMGIIMPDVGMSVNGPIEHYRPSECSDSRVLDFVKPPKGFKARLVVRAWRHRGKGPRFLRLGRSVRYLPGRRG